MIRYYLSPMVGLGTELDPFRPAIADLGGVNWSAAVGVGAMALVVVNAPEAEHARLRADTRSWAFPMQFAPAVEPPAGPAIGRKAELQPYFSHAITSATKAVLVNRLQAMLALSVDWIDPAVNTAGDVIIAVLERIEGRPVDLAGLWISR